MLHDESVRLPVGIETLAPAREGTPSRRVLFVTDNGHGLGHVSRMMAVARRLPANIDSRFVTLSRAYPIIAQAGFPVTYIPSYKQFAGARSAWLEMACQRLLEILSAEEFDELVLDHVRPWKFLRRVKKQHPSLALTWCRRGLWKPGRNEATLALEKLFERVMEPMDLASVHDRGGTTMASGAHRVPPVTLLDRSEMLDTETARHSLGLATDTVCVLLQLSADTPERLHRVVDSARELVHRTDPAATLVVPIHPLHPDIASGIEGVVAVPRYPMARYFRAFDYAISTAGYNTFHELVVAAVPTLFIARETDSLDNQPLRASIAPLVGFGLHITTLAKVGEARAALVNLADPQQRRRMRAAAEELIPDNGAHRAAGLLAERLTTRELTRE